MSRAFEFSLGEFYHLYNRGTEKRKIFLARSEHERFLGLMYLCNSDLAVHISAQGKNLDRLLEIPRTGQLVDIGAYCLMPNHFHILVRERVENGISRFIQKLATGYTMYFNTRHERTGALFQGVFKATHVSHDNYLKYLLAYIHLNPIKLIQSDWKDRGITDHRGAMKFLSSYTYSSYLDFIGAIRAQKRILNPAEFPEYFEETHSFENMISFWLNFTNESPEKTTKAKP